MTPNQSISPPISSTVAVYNAVCELHANEMPATRETVAEITRLPLTTVDDRLKHLTDEKDLQRILRGHYIPVAKFPVARPITKTTLADGMVVLEIGETVLHLTPKEARQLANDLAGERENYVTTAAVRNQMLLTAEMASKIEVLMRQIKALHEKQDPHQGVLELSGTVEA
jgi:hypothetical protein